jgi:hypothetical protein
MTLAADLADLYRMGYEDLPYLADHFEAATEDCWTLRSEFGAFTRTPELGYGGGLGPWTEFASLGNALEDILAEETRNLRGMGKAIVQCAKAYAEADDGASSSFTKLVAGLDGVPDGIE